MTLTLPPPCFLLAVSPTATTAPRITRSNSIPTHDSTFELYSTSQMGSTLSLADKSKGMIRSGSFRDPVDDGESALCSCPGRGRCRGLVGLTAPLSLPTGAAMALLDGSVCPILGTRAGTATLRGLLNSVLASALDLP